MFTTGEVVPKFKLMAIACKRDSFIVDDVQTSHFRAHFPKFCFLGSKDGFQPTPKDNHMCSIQKRTRPLSAVSPVTPPKQHVTAELISRRETGNVQCLAFYIPPAKKQQTNTKKPKKNIPFPSKA